MPRPVLILALVFTLATPACDAPRPSPSAPRMVLQEVVYDFGAVEQGTNVSHAFRLSNAGGLALSIDNLRSSCDCTATVAPARVIAPGGSAAADVLFDTARASGHQSKTVSVYSNDPSQPVITLTLTGRVTAELAAEPPHLYVGHLGRGETARNGVSLSGIAGITAVEAAGKVIEATLISAAASDRGKHIQVRVRKSAPLGRFEDTITVHTNSARQPQLNVPVTGVVDGDIVASPAQVSFGQTTPGARASRVIELQNRGDRPIRVTAARLLPALGTVAVTLDRDGRDSRITVTLNQSIGVGRFSGILEVETDHAEQPRIEVQFSGRVVEKSS